ncbi:ATP-binding protein [Haloarcula pelagica]|uniref:ATP-binding protein n=1 Tax=Haloarcula pelagica TaxID=3033389 RepID=UPI0024C41493|nr:helicase HerA-like domain-containing protein [Halomicroarcula sp. YJ-61-S]
MVVIGREGESGPTARLGHYRARDGSRGARVDLDLDGPHAGLVVGKRGTGKSYTLGVLAEALAESDGVAPVVVDPMGGFAGLAAGDTPATVVEPRVRAGSLAPREWCALLGLDPERGAGSLLWRAASRHDTLQAMCRWVESADADRSIRRATTNHLALAADWDVFDPDGLDAAGLDGPGATVLDLSGRARRPASAVLAAVATALYEGRVDGTTTRLPWLLVDEAHAFTDGVAAGPLRRLVTRGHQPGVSLWLATQRPSALPTVAVSQADLHLTHRLTSRADIEALAAAHPTYLDGDWATRLPEAPGEALVVDDTTESVHHVRVRERRTPHGGGSPRASAVVDP